MTQEERKKHQVVSYTTLRIMIGFLGLGLPVIVAAGDIMLNYGCSDYACGIRDSISDYHASGMRDVFSGILFVLGFFLFAYKGYEPIDDIIANWGGAFALGVALLPCDSECEVVKNLYFISAILLFVVFIIFSLYLFRKKSPDDKVKLFRKDEDMRRRIYFWCGIAMIVFLLCIAASYWLLPPYLRNEYNIVFWFETLALWAFGTSWITKAEVGLKG